MKFILLNELTQEEKLGFLADVIDEEKKDEPNTIRIRLHRSYNGNVDPEGILMEVSITPVEILDTNGTFNYSSKEVEIKFYNSFRERLTRNIRSSTLFDADGEMVICKEGGKQVVWPFTMKNLRVLSSSDVRDGELFIELVQLKDQDSNRCKKIVAKADLEDLVFKVIDA